MSDCGNQGNINDLHQLLTEYTLDIRNFKTILWMPPIQMRRMWYIATEIIIANNLAMTEPLKPPIHCVECFHGLSHLILSITPRAVWLSPYYNEKLRVRDVKNDFHIPLVYGGVRVTTVTVGVRVLPLKKPGEYFGFRELTTDECALKQQKVKSDSLDLGGSPSNYQESVIKIMEKPMIPLSQRRWHDGGFLTTLVTVGDRKLSKNDFYPSIFIPSGW